MLKKMVACAVGLVFPLFGWQLGPSSVLMRLIRFFQQHRSLFSSVRFKIEKFTGRRRISLIPVRW